ncbi:SET domain-containing protein-lysine N-methyltransferase [Pseudomonas orientalis]|uniref:SET domain-containing protein-lysine N-methyltransferase n=1 Tax=Pseudomonas orientalis TaxID=76758 RepID=UPI000F57D1D2|nr:SET domain-containing protein-lysine N-methyltransferase [Pseudomonas orientalis]AZE89336.1 hypothetical protein C4J97_2635 [Pseudomonas orientalis]
MTGISPALTHVSLPQLSVADVGSRSQPGAVQPPQGSHAAVSTTAAQPSPGNLGGALSWPVPLSADEQSRLCRITENYAHPLGDEPLVMQFKGGVLEFLRYRQPLPAHVGNDPARLLDALVRSPQGQRMGKALQQRMQGIDSQGSATDYLLAGLALRMDPESITAPHRNQIAGFDIADDQYWGHAPSAVVKGLASCLQGKGRVSSALAEVSAHLLLARRAPQFLIKGLPPHVRVGSQAWAHLTIAAMILEAQTPGKVAGMTFAQVMNEAATASLLDPALTQQTQTAALLDWGEASGIIPKRNNDAFTSVQLERVRTAFNRQLDARLAASRSLDSALPTRKEIALATLKARFGDLGALFEVKALSTDRYRGENGQQGFSGTHSLLDYAMMDLPNPRPLISTDSRIPVAALNANPTFGVREAFEQQFARAIAEKKLAVNTVVRHMIAQLPLDDRKNFEWGKVSFFQQGSYVTDGLFNHTRGPNKPGLIVRTELGGRCQAYEIDINKSAIRRTDLFRAAPQERRESSRFFTTKELAPGQAAGELGTEHRTNNLPLNSFDSARSRSIADVYVQHIDLDDPAIKLEARGLTPIDAYFSPKPLSELLLNLIPFRSAVVNLHKGNYGEATFDLLVDIFGFLTAGAATAGKLIKIGGAALSTGAKALKASTAIGVAAIGMLNPVSGAGDLVRLVGSAGPYLLTKGIKGINRLRGATASYDLLKAVSKQYDAAAMGILKVSGESVEGAAVLKKGHWYSFDADTMQPYGSPLDDFKVATQAVAGNVDIAHFNDVPELSHGLFGQYSVPDSRIAALSRNSQGVYVATDGHLSHIRHTDNSGKTAVYEVRQVTRTQDGVVQARVYHNNRQTELLVQHVQGDQWQRVGALGGGQITAEHLRAWENLSPEERLSVTRRGFARQHRISPNVFECYVKRDGQLSDTGLIVRNRPVDTPVDEVTETHIRTWQTMTQPERDQMTIEGFAGRYNLDPKALGRKVRPDGSVTSHGQVVLSRAADHTYSNITDELLLNWKTLSEEPGNLVTAEDFVREHNLNPSAWHAYVRGDGSLTTKATKRIARVHSRQVPNVPPVTIKKRIEVITAQHLQDWEALPHEGPLSISRAEFARLHNLSRKTFEYYVQADGALSPTGLIVRSRPAGTPFIRVDVGHIRDWRNMTQQAREAMTLPGFAGHHHLHPDSFRNCVRVDGSLGPAGVVLLETAAGLIYNRLTPEHLRMWNTRLPTSAVSQSQFIRTHKLSPRDWAQYVKNDGSLSERGLKKLDEAQKRPAQATSDEPPSKKTADTPQSAVETPDLPAAVPTVAIKVEPITFPALPRHQVDNTLPILQDPQNPRLSLTQAIEGPTDMIRITHWNGLLDGLDSATRQRVSAHMKESIKDWLRTEGQHQSRFDKTLEVVTALDDGGPDRGASVWARRDIAQFEVLGPYAGKYHASEASLFAEQRKQGSRAVLTYLFGTRSGNRSVSALHTGNTLSLINTSQLGTGPAWKSNNVICVAVGKNLTFYVALNDIKKGEELLVDYGPLYKTVPDIAIKPEPAE